MNFHKIYLPVIAVLLLYIFFLRTCGKAKPCDATTVSVKHDTTYTPVHDTFYSKPVLTGEIVPTAADVATRIKAMQQTAPRITEERAPGAVTPDDYFYPGTVATTKESDNAVQERLLRDYFTSRFYTDTQSTRYGKLVIQDTVSSNRIAGRSIQTLFDIPVVNTTTEKEVRRFQVFTGPVLMGKSFVPTAGGVQLLAKTKGDNVYSAAVLFGPVTQYQVGAAFKIKFK